MAPDVAGGLKAVSNRLRLGDRVGVYGAAAVLLVWGGFAVACLVSSPLTRFETNAVVLACGIAVLAVGPAGQLSTARSPFSTVFVASPFIVVAATLAPVVALLLWGTYPAVPVSRLPSVVAFVERSVLDPVGFADTFANTFDREGVGYTLSWLLYSVPLGWLLGSAVLQIRFLAGADL